MAASQNLAMSFPMVPFEDGGLPQKRPFTRVISRMDVKGPNLVKGIHLEGLRVIGNPAEYAVRYYNQGVDELLYIDIVASLYGRNNLIDIVSETASKIYIPLTVGGGIRSIDDIHKLLRAGADKVAINTAAIRTPELLSEAARAFGSQCIVISVEAKRSAPGRWEAYTDNGRERTGLEAVDWIRRAVDLGAGEVLLTSVDQEGTRKGFDLELLAAVGPNITVPVVASGGAGNADHVADAVRAGADAVAVAGLLHYNMQTVASLKSALHNKGISVRC